MNGASQIMKRAKAYLGSATADAMVGPLEVVDFRDESPFGESYEGRALLAVRTTGLRVEREGDGESAAVDVTLVLDEVGRLLCAFTDPKDEWVLSADGSYKDAETRAQESRMTVRPLLGDEHCVSSVAEVLGALWGRWGIVPTEPGQVVLRPRFVTRYYPAREVNGEWEPVSPPGPYWLAEIRGMVTLVRHGTYYSGQLIAIDDVLERQEWSSQGPFLP